MIKDAASALGEYVGKLIEDTIRELIEEITKRYGLRIGNKKLYDKVGVDFEIDFPIFKENTCVALIDVKYLRYKKHARDKSSWVVVAHNRLRATYPTIKRCLVILLGTGWTEPAKKLVSSSCIDVLDIEPEILIKILSKYNIAFAWNEKDDVTPKIALQEFQKLTEDKKKQIGREIVESIGLREKIENWFKQYIIGEDPPEEKLRLDYICKKDTTLDKFIS